MNLAELGEGLRRSRGILHKRDIAGVVAALGLPGVDGVAGTQVVVGDDCAAIADGDGYLLFAIEGLLGDFVAAQPWFAGYCAVMVNVSDVYAMGGRPMAVVDALWSRDAEHGLPLLQGMACAARAYGVPIVGGHSNARSDGEQLAVSLLGRARRLLTSFHAKPGDTLVAAIDLRGRYHDPYSFWDASTEAPSTRLRADLELLPAFAEAGLCSAAKDISMAGVLGTALMLLECSGLGAVIDPAAVPAPAGVPSARWLLSTFPSYGFLLSVSSEALPEVLHRFARRAIPAAAIGRCDASRQVRLCSAGEECLVWDFDREPLIGCGPIGKLAA